MKQVDIDNELSKLEEDIAKMDTFLLASGRPMKDNSIIGDLHDLKRRVIRVHFMIDVYEYNNKSDVKKKK